MRIVTIRFRQPNPTVEDEKINSSPLRTVRKIERRLFLYFHPKVRQMRQWRVRYRYDSIDSLRPPCQYPILPDLKELM